DVPGRPALFGTTKAFLDYFGLKRLDELPPLSELKDIGELEPQLPLDGDGQPAAPLPAGARMDEDGEAANDASADAPATMAPGMEAEDSLDDDAGEDGGAQHGTEDES